MQLSMGFCGILVFHETNIQKSCATCDQTKEDTINFTWNEDVVVAVDVVIVRERPTRKKSEKSAREGRSYDKYQKDKEILI